MNSALLPTLEMPATLPSNSSSDSDVTSFQVADGSIQTGKRCFKNRYEIVRRLGRGGFGTTYLAQDTSAELSTAQPMPCVIKQMRYRKPPAAQGDLPNAKAAFSHERMKRRFQKETRMMARLGRHNQLPCLLDHFTDDGQFYLVQEHVDGHTISREINQSGPQTEREVKQFLREMLPIVQYIHRQGLLHLDIKPSNIIRRSGDQKLVLIDFGAVRRYPDVALAEAGDRGAGTIGFAPSEQLAGQPTYASDIYSLGVTCLYLLTKISPLDLAIAPQGQNLRWQESVRLTPHFTRVLTKMLHPDAARRFQTIEALERAMNLEPHYEALKPCLATEPLLAQKAKPSACLIESYAEEAGRSQAQRQAESIRRWKQRRQQFKTFTPK